MALYFQLTLWLEWRRMQWAPQRFVACWPFVASLIYCLVLSSFYFRTPKLLSPSGSLRCATEMKNLIPSNIILLSWIQITLYLVTASAHGTLSRDNSHPWYPHLPVSPGRFFAANGMKTIFTHILLNYDIQLENGSMERPQNIYFGTSSMPNLNAKVMFRKRRTWSWDFNIFCLGLNLFK